MKLDSRSFDGLLGTYRGFGLISLGESDEILSLFDAAPRNGGGARPIEVASGPLMIHGAKMGCDLRPIDPDHPFAGAVPACCGVDAKGSSPHYCDPKDLGRARHVIP